MNKSDHPVISNTFGFNEKIDPFKYYFLNVGLGFGQQRSYFWLKER